MRIDYNFRKRPLIFYIVLILILGVLLATLLKEWSIFGLIVFTMVICYQMREYLIFEYKFLKWFESQLKRSERTGDQNYFHNQSITYEIYENKREINFLKMGYYTENDLKSIGEKLNDFIIGYTFQNIEYDKYYIKLIYLKNRERLEIEKDHFSKSIFPLDNGIRLDNELFLKNFNHILVSGKTGSGKSYFAHNYLIPHFLKMGKVYIIDTKNTIPLDIKNQATEFSNIAKNGLEIIKELDRIMEDRYNQSKLNEEAIFLIMEEMIAFRFELEKEELKEFDKLLKKILVKGRESNIHIILISQSFNVGKEGVFANSGTRDQFDTKFNFGPISTEQAQQIFGIGKNELPKYLDNSLGSGYYQKNEEIYFYQSPLIKKRMKELKKSTEPNLKGELPLP